MSSSPTQPRSPAAASRLAALKARIAALQSQKSGDLHQARLDFTKTLENDPHDVVCLYSLAAIATEDGELNEALDLINRALAVHPYFAPSLLARSIIHARRGAKLDALNDLQAAEAIDPGLEGLAQQRAALTHL